MAKKAKETVDDYMAKLDHPLKAEVEALRTFIKSVHPGIIEQVKWNAPSYSYADKDYIATFNLHKMEYAFLIFHNPAIATIKHAILEGDYTDRRMVYFYNMADVEAKKPGIDYVIRELIRVMDGV